MDNLQAELNELKQFIVDLKADRAATKEKEKREAWTKYVSLTVVLIAVVTSIAAQWGADRRFTPGINQAVRQERHAAWVRARERASKWDQ